jgi:thioredoxin-related protein
MKKIVVIAILLVVFGLSSFAQETKVKWYTFEEAIELNKKEKRKIFIDVYTDWCGWCKKMDATTFTSPQIAKILNEDYYAVKFDAEQKEEVIFKGQTFKFVANGRRGYHELAAALLNNKLSFPSVAYLNEESQLLTAVPGYQTPDNLEPILMFFADDAFKTQSFKEFQETFKKQIN